MAQLREPVRVRHREAGLAGATLEVEEELAAQRFPARVAVQHPAVRRQVSRLVRRGPAAECLQLGQFIRGGQLLVREAQQLGEVAALVTDLHYEARWRGSWLRRIRCTMRRTWAFASAIPRRMWGASRAGSRPNSRPSAWYAAARTLGFSASTAARASPRSSAA